MKQNEYDKLLKALSLFPSKEWINQYFDLVKRFMLELEITDDNPRLAMALNDDYTLPVNIGQRYVIKPLLNERMRCIIPSSVNEKDFNADIYCYYNPRTTRDAKWIELDYALGSKYPPKLFRANMVACKDILAKVKRSGFRRYHCSLLYDFAMYDGAREEILGEV